MQGTLAGLRAPSKTSRRQTGASASRGLAASAPPVLQQASASAQRPGSCLLGRLGPVLPDALRRVFVVALLGLTRCGEAESTPPTTDAGVASGGLGAATGGAGARTGGTGVASGGLGAATGGTGATTGGAGAAPTGGVGAASGRASAASGGLGGASGRTGTASGGTGAASGGTGAATGGAQAAGTGGQAASTGRVTMDTLAHEWAVAICGSLDRCYPETAAMLVAYWLDCVDYYDKLLQDGMIPAVARAVASGSMAFDAALMDSCLEQYATASCESIARQSSDSPCRQGLHGLLPTGSACTLDLECADGLCGSTGTCPGTCEPLHAVGGSCTTALQCAPGLACSGTLCVVAVGAGEPCGTSAQGAACATGLFCRTDLVTGTNQCASIFDRYTAREGELCGYTSVLCEAGLTCMAVASSSVGADAEYRCQLPVASRAPCRAGIPDPCPPNEYCPVSILDAASVGTCTPRSPAGGPCDPLALWPCVGDAVCSQAGTCVTRQRLGGPCAQDDECYSLRCQGGACVTPDDCSD
jgi:hypothetical protein